jgi:hypothetical protein
VPVWLLLAVPLLELEGVAVWELLAVSVCEDVTVEEGVHVGVMDIGVRHTVTLSTSSSEGWLLSTAFITRKVR